ncbi:MAG TPA: hypothetical protein VIY49_02215 [Bryobacteraceae bacterium]
MKLSFECVLIYVLRHSGCAGRLQQGSVERYGSAELNVYDSRGRFMEYISGSKMRSWCLFQANDAPIKGWCYIHPEDRLVIREFFAYGA